MEGFCRGCLIKYEEPTDLLQYTEKNRRLYVYSTGLQVKRTDVFSFQLCKDCYMNMKQACIFKKQCRTSDKRFKHFLSLKESGELTDFCTYLKNNDDTLSFRFPILNSNSTPFHNRKDDDNDSTCTSIRNFMTDMLPADEIPDTEARIIREVIEEEADVLDESLDSHWLQDDISIDTDFRLDFSFSPFSTPRSGNNERITSPKKIKDKPHETANIFTTKDKQQETAQIISEESLNAIEQIMLESNNKQNLTETENVTFDPISVKIERIEDNITENNLTETENVTFDPISVKIERIEDITEENLTETENVTFNPISVKIERIEDITEETDTQDLIPSCGNFNIEKGKLNPDKSCIKITETMKKKDCINRNLEQALRNTENNEFSLDAILATPPICPGASSSSTPSITKILYGEKKINENSNSHEQKVGHCIEKYVNVEGSDGNTDILEDFFNKETGEYIDDKKEKVPEVSFEKKNQAKHIEKHNINIEKPGISKFDLSDFSCKLCDKRYASVKALKIHFAKIHKHKIFGPRKKNHIAQEVICDYCGSVFNFLSNLKRHIKSHLYPKKKDGKVYQCKTCSLEFSAEAKLNMHMRTHIGQKAPKPQKKTFPCPTCGLQSSSLGNLGVHMRRHAKNYTYKCKECDRGYYRKTDMDTHMRTHSGERPFQCSKCVRKFSRRDALNRHMKLHTDERPHICRYCKATFIKKQDMLTHIEKSKACIKLRQKIAEQQEEENKNESSHIVIEELMKVNGSKLPNVGDVDLPSLSSTMEEIVENTETDMVVEEIDDEQKIGLLEALEDDEIVEII